MTGTTPFKIFYGLDLPSLYLLVLEETHIAYLKEQLIACDEMLQLFCVNLLKAQYESPIPSRFQLTRVFLCSGRWCFHATLAFLKTLTGQAKVWEAPFLLFWSLYYCSSCWTSGMWICSPRNFACPSNIPRVFAAFGSWSIFCYPFSCTVHQWSMGINFGP